MPRFTKRISAVAVIILWGLLITDATCADNSATVAFARANAEKFKNEIVETKGVALGSTVTVQGVISEIDLMGLGMEYDPKRGEMVIGFSQAELYRLMFFESCKPNGSFLGQNTFGAKTKVRRENCDRFYGQDENVMGVNVGGIRIKMSPSQFRTIKKGGVQAEFDLTVGPSEKDIVVDFSDSISEATIDNPVQSHMKVWTIYGQIQEIRWVLPGDKQGTLVWARRLTYGNY